MPEGNQGEQRKLRTFTKGIFRIAFDAQQKYGTNPGVKIIPVGIDFEDIKKYGKQIIINIGKPIEVSDYMTSYAENPVIATNEIRDRLRSDIKKITLDLATETHYQCFETIVGIANTAFAKKEYLPGNTVFQFVARQRIAEKLVAIEKNEPEKIEELELLCKEYTGSLKLLNLRNWVFERPTYKATALLLDGLMLFATLPLFIYGFILNFLPFFAPVLIRKHLINAKYPGFFSSLHFGIGIFTFPLFYILQTVGFGLFSTSWWLTLLFFVSQYFFGKWAYQWYREALKFVAKTRFRYLTHNKSAILERTQNLHKKIIQLINI
jgi:glycerol-3-phosphate O-acyltransferase/dihydroxyacetone phosphate acyltransferase